MPLLLSRGRHVAPAPARVTWREVFAVREFRGLFAAYVTSLIGDQLAKVALAILVFDRTDNAFLGSATYAVTFLPALISGPLLGWTADRLRRREVMIFCDLARALLVLPMLIPGLGIPALLSLLLAVSFLEPPFLASRAALMPDVLVGDLYPTGQSVTSVTMQASQVLGYAAGGGLVAVLHPRGALAIDCITFVVSAAIVLVFSKPRPVRDTSFRSSPWSLMTDGAAEVLRRRDLRLLLCLTVASLALIIATEGLAVSYAAQIGRGPLATGFLTAALPAGSALGIVLIVRIRASQRIASMRFLGVVWALPLVASALRPDVIVTFLLWSLSGLLGGFQILANILFTSILRPENRGRVLAFAQSLMVFAQGIGLLFAGAIARFTSPATAVALAGLLGVILCGAVSLRLRDVQSLIHS